MKTSTSRNKRKQVTVLASQHDECIWMKAGVVNYKLCDNAFDCLNCPFDKAMSRSLQGHDKKLVSWRRTMRDKPYEQKECRHMLSGRVPYRLCANEYRCHLCEFDQALEEADLQVVPGGTHTHRVAGFQVADNYYYHRGHSWARIEHGGFVRLGLDDFALRLLGRPTQIQLPKLGSHLEQTTPGWTLQREAHSARMLAPMNGVVVATNHKVLQHAELAKQDPYGQGWLVVVEPHALKQNLRDLLFDQEVAGWLQAEADKLATMAMKGYGMSLAATGGEMVDDIFGNLPDPSPATWDRLVHEFLLT